MTNKGNPMVGARIPSEWLEQYQELATARGCKVAELVRTALGEYLKTQGDISDITLDSNLESRISAIEDMIGDIKDIKVITKRFHLVESQLKELQDTIANLEGKKQSSEPEKKPVTEEWLTTGEAYEEAKKRGLTQSAGTFRRWLRDSGEKEKLHDTLESLQLEANWAIRKEGNSKSKSLRWLRFND